MRGEGLGFRVEGAASSCAVSTVTAQYQGVCGVCGVCGMDSGEGCRVRGQGLPGCRRLLRLALARRRWRVEGVESGEWKGGSVGCGVRSSV